MDKIFLLLYILLSTKLSLCHENRHRYEPTWDSLDSRPLPKWYDDAKIGIFIHMGVYSVPSFVSAWLWCYWKCPNHRRKDVIEFMRKHYPPGFTYQDFARDFKLEFFNATEWVELFEKSGAKYAVLTTKHHEGYTLWPSKYSYSWNSMDVGPKRDIVGEFTLAVRKSNLHLGLYHSLYEWFNPLYMMDKKNNFTTRVFPHAKTIPELYELVNSYQPDLIWSDGDAGPVDYWNSTGFLAWLYNDSPVRNKVVVNDRWGTGTACHHGGFFNCADRYNPGQKQTRKWENAMTLDKTAWIHRRNAKIEDFLTIEELLRTLGQTISYGGNLLVDVGPTKEGTIPVIMQERLLQMGEFLKINGEAIYGTSEWKRANDTVTMDVFYTSNPKNGALYAMFLKWPTSDTLVLGAPNPKPNVVVSLLGFDEPYLPWKMKGGKMIIALPSLSRVQYLKFAWVVKIKSP